MSALGGTITALILIFAAGFGATILLKRDAERIDLLEITALSWLLGAGVISLSLWALGILLRGIPLLVAVTIIVVASGLIGSAEWRKKKLALSVPWPRTWVESALACLLLLGIALVGLLTFKHTLGWDGLIIWELKARYIYLNGGALPSPYFFDSTRAFTHAEYPLFLPMIEAWLYFWIGDCDQYWVKLIFPIFYVAGVFLLVRAGEFLSDRRWIGLVAANLYLFVPSLTRTAGGIILGYADVPLSILYLAAFYFLVVFARTNSASMFSIFIALAALLPWLKREGIVLWLVLASCGAFIIWRRRGFWSGVWSLLPGLFIFGSWQIYLRAMHTRSQVDFLPINFGVLFSNFYRLGPILQSLVAEISRVSQWNLLWFGVLAAFICLMVRRREAVALMLAICFFGPLAFDCCVYLFSAWPDYLHHVRSSLSRLLLQLVPMSILSIAFALVTAPDTTAAKTPRLTLQGRLRRGQSRYWNAKRTATHVVQT